MDLNRAAAFDDEEEETAASPEVEELGVRAEGARRSRHDGGTGGQRGSHSWTKLSNSNSLCARQLDAASVAAEIREGGGELDAAADALLPRGERGSAL